MRKLDFDDLPQIGKTLVRAKDWISHAKIKFSNHINEKESYKEIYDILSGLKDKLNNELIELRYFGFADMPETSNQPTAQQGKESKNGK